MRTLAKYITGQDKSLSSIKPKQLVYLLILALAASTFYPLFAGAAETDCETMMRMALTNKTTAIFDTLEDCTFDSNIGGIRTSSTDGRMSSYNMTAEKAQEFLKGFITKKTIRITNGAATIDQYGYRCSMQVLPGNKGIAISITRGSATSVTQGQLNGIIKENTLAGTAEASQNVRVNGVGSGRTAYGQFSVSLKALPANEWPPMPLVNLALSENEDHSINLSWQDPNPSGVVKEYDIYREAGLLSGFVKAATASNCTSWVDDSETAKTETFTLAYYVVARGKNGAVSAMSYNIDFDPIKLMNRFCKM